MPVLGHGYGTASGQSAFDVTSEAPPGSMPCISYMAHPSATTIRMGSPVVLSSNMAISNASFYPACSPDPSLTIDSISTQISRGGACIGWPNFTTTGGGCSQSVFGTLETCAVSLTTTPGGATGKAFVSARCSGYVLRDSDAGDAGGKYAHIATSSELGIASNKSTKISGALVRRHTGLWKIVSTEGILDPDGNDLGIDLCVLDRQPFRHRWFVADITGIDEGSSTDYLKYYNWTGPGGISSGVGSVNQLAVNLVEAENGSQPGDYVSDQELDKIGDWSMLETRRYVFMHLDILDDGSYTAQFSRASQFMGDCWDL